MNFQKYIAKLSPENLIINLQSKSMAEDICATIDQDDFFALRKACKGKQHLMDFKYFNFEPWIRENVRRALKLGILQRRHISILDIGTGFGYFPYVCNCWHGHTVKAIDIEGQILYDAVTDFLGIDKKHYSIKKFEPMESLGTKFDLITCFLVAFDRPSVEEIWGPAEWDFFIKDMKENHLTDTGEIFLRLNPIPRVNGWYLPGVDAIFKKHGAKVRAAEVRIRK
ncbi:MAG: hypothetical protein GKS00_12045 [Alphaproteobacteria bacterium]|nr:hypothetical protein [Alphaproteobacteria bacterium]